MNLDAQTLAYITNVVETARLVSIENVVIEPGIVRGVTEERTVVLLQKDNVPEFDFGSIGLNRIDIFTARYELAKIWDNVVVDASLDDTKSFVRSLVMKGKGAKIDYRCANPTTIKSPKTLNDPVKYKVKMTPEAVLFITRGVSAMKADTIELIGNDEGVSFKMEDINKDAFVYKFADAAEVVDGKGDQVTFAHTYPIKHLLTLLKQRADSPFFLTQRGMIKLNINNLDLYIPPRT